MMEVRESGSHSDVVAALSDKQLRAFGGEIESVIRQLSTVASD